MLLQGKRILITGVINQWSAAWAIALAIVAEGGEVGFTYLNDKARDNISDLCSDSGIVPAFILGCDVGSDQQIDQLAVDVQSVWPQFNGFLHSIAHANREDLGGAYLNVTREGFIHTLDISAYSFTALARVFHPMLREGSSLLTLSYLGAERAVLNYNVMGVAKAALEASVRYLARDLGADNIRVNALSPGVLKTLSARGISDFSSLLDYFESRVLLSEPVNTSSVAGSAVYLFSDLSKVVTGEVIHVDAGFHVIA